jgi:hypothetical protein
VADRTVDPAREACNALVRHLLSRLVDDPEFIECSGRLTRTYELLMDAAIALHPSEERTSIERRILDERSAILKYRPLLSYRVRAEQERDELRALLVCIAEDYTLDEHSMRALARGAL